MLALAAGRQSELAAAIGQPCQPFKQNLALLLARSGQWGHGTGRRRKHSLVCVKVLVTVLFRLLSAQVALPALLSAAALAGPMVCTTSLEAPDASAPEGRTRGPDHL